VQLLFRFRAGFKQEVIDGCPKLVPRLVHINFMLGVYRLSGVRHWLFWREGGGFEDGDVQGSQCSDFYWNSSSSPRSKITHILRIGNEWGATCSVYYCMRSTLYRRFIIVMPRPRLKSWINSSTAQKATMPSTLKPSINTQCWVVWRPVSARYQQLQYRYVYTP